MTTVEPTNQDRQREGPDGGWGWVLVGALFVCNSLVFGLMRSSGVFFMEFVQYFDESSQAISWIPSIGLAAQQFFSELLQPCLSHRVGILAALTRGGVSRRPAGLGALQRL